MLLHSDYKSGVLTDTSGASTEGFADLIIPKWRNGETMELKLVFEGSKMKFSELDAFRHTNLAYETQGDNPRAGIKNNYATGFTNTSTPYTNE